METAVVNTKEIIRSLTEAFDKNDVEMILSHMTEDVQWHIMGQQVLSGKKSIEDFFKAFPDMKMTSSTKDHFVIDGDTAVVNGEVQCEDSGSGVIHDMFYCDIYDLRDGKVRKLTSYCVNKKKTEAEAK